MRKRNYYYRIKTLEEFKNEFGDNWRYYHTTFFTEFMDYLFGHELSSEFELVDSFYDKDIPVGCNRVMIDEYTIRSYMIAKIQSSPCYGRKKLI